MDSWINVNGENVQTLQILFMTTLLVLLPSMVVMMTSFTRYIISFSFLRSAMGLQQNPPNMVLVGMALFLTLFTMSPVISEIQTTAYEPYVAQEITQEEFIDRAKVPLKEFMLRNTEQSSLDLFCDLAGRDTPADSQGALDLPLRIVVPSFVTTELKRAFEIGFYLYIPFLLIDIVVASALMSMGMIMLPPSMISMPFKLLLFISLNGWELLFSTLNAELHSYGDGTVIRCAEPSESDGSRALASADLDNDGRAEQIICEKAFGGYELCVVDDNGEELMRDRMWEGDVYFLCRENGRDMLLQYSLDEGKNQDAISYCAYYYGLHTFDGGKLNIVENNNTSIYLNWDGTQNGDWGESQQAFAARVNELIDQSKFLIAQQDGELILTSEVQRWYCVSPKTIRVAMDDTTIYIDRKSWDFAEQYPSLKGFEDIGTAGNYFVAFGSMGEKNDLYVVFNFVAGTLLKTFPGNNLIWQGDDLSTAVYSYRSDVYALNGTKLAALELASGEEISGLALAPDGVSIIATVSGKSGERKVTVTREGSA